jgi:DNA repair exonuclease SbcCD ATPase subunit
MTLIHGPSGRGKTSILLAIQFALYGSLNQKYLISYNKTSCEVILIYKNFKVKRTKRPNILNVELDGRLYEDQEAQILLNKYFGIRNSSVVFMDLSHLEKMEFLENIANSGYDVNGLKIRLKTEISQLNKDLAILDGKISNTESMLEIVQKPDRVEKPIKKGSLLLSKNDLILKKEETLKQIEFEVAKKLKYTSLMGEVHTIKNEIDSLGSPNQNTLQEVQILQKHLLELKEKNNHLEKLRDKSFVVEEALKELEKYKNVDESQLSDLNNKITMVKETITKCIKNKDAINRRKEIERLVAGYEEALKMERSEWQNEVLELEKELKIYSKESMDEYEPKSLSKIERLCENFKEATAFNLKYNLEDIHDQIQALKLKFFKKYNCVNCDHAFSINMDTFEMVEEIPEEENFEKVTDSIRNQLKDLLKLKEKIEENHKLIEKTNLVELMDKITLIKNYIKISNKLKELGSFKPSLSLSKMKSNLEKLRSKSILEIDDSLSKIDLDSLKDEGRDLTIQQEKLCQQLKVKNNLLKKIQNAKPYDSLEHESVKLEIERVREALNSSNLEVEKLKVHERLIDKLKSLKIQVENIEYEEDRMMLLRLESEDIDKCIEYDNNLSDYKNFQIKLGKYKKVKDTLKNFMNEKKTMEKIYLKTLLFKQKVVEAEQESLEFMVQVINTHLSILLQEFFSENFGDPIQIYLELSNDKKPQVNTVINYNGNRVDYKSLSTGESARVKLAFDLTFKEILGENIIMLDECTANLDQDLSTRILSKIKSTFPSKTILVVAHQVVMGTFENVINL